MIPSELEARIKNLAATQQNRWEQLRIAARNAATQAQSVRIEMLENPQNTSFSEYIADVLLSLLVGPLAGKAIGLIANRLFRPALRSRSVLVTIAQREAREETTTTPFSFRRASAFVSSRKVLHFTRRTPEHTLLRDGAELFAKQSLTSAKAVVLKWNRKNRVAAEARLGGDRPEVAIQRYIDKLVGAQVLSGRKEINRLWSRLRETPAPELIKAAEQWTAEQEEDFDYKFDTHPEALDPEENMSRYFEAAIWVSMFRIDRIYTEGVQNGGNQTGDPRFGRLDMPAHRWNVKAALAKYWLDRFPHQETLAVRFRSFADQDRERGLLAGKLASEGYSGRRIAELLPKQKEHELIQYFRRVARALQGEGMNVG